MSVTNTDTGGPPRCLDTSLSLSYFQLSLSYFQLSFSNFQLRCKYHSITSGDDGDIECLWLMLIPVVLTRDYCQRKTEGPHAQITRQIPSSLSSSLDKYHHHRHHHLTNTIIIVIITRQVPSSVGKYHHHCCHHSANTIINDIIIW